MVPLTEDVSTHTAARTMAVDLNAEDGACPEHGLWKLKYVISILRNRESNRKKITGLGIVVRKFGPMYFAVLHRVMTFAIL